MARSLPDAVTLFRAAVADVLRLYGYNVVEAPINMGLGHVCKRAIVLGFLEEDSFRDTVAVHTVARDFLEKIQITLELNKVLFIEENLLQLYAYDDANDGGYRFTVVFRFGLPVLPDSQLLDWVGKYSTEKDYDAAQEIVNAQQPRIRAEQILKLQSLRTRLDQELQLLTAEKPLDNPWITPQRNKI